MQLTVTPRPFPRSPSCSLERTDPQPSVAGLQDRMPCDHLIDVKRLEEERVRVLQPFSVEKRSPLGYRMPTLPEEVQTSVRCHLEDPSGPSLDRMSPEHQRQIRAFVVEQVVLLLTSDEFRLGLHEVHGQEAVDQLLGVGETGLVEVEIRDESVLITRNGETREFKSNNFGQYGSLIADRLKEGMAGLRELLASEDVTGITVEGDLAASAGIAKEEEPVSQEAALASALTIMNLAVEEIKDVHIMIVEIINKADAAIDLPNDSSRIELEYKRVLSVMERSYTELQTVLQKQSRSSSFYLQLLVENYKTAIEALRMSGSDPCRSALDVKNRAKLVLKASFDVGLVQWIIQDRVSRHSLEEREQMDHYLQAVQQNIERTPSLAVLYASRVYKALLWLSLLDAEKELAATVSFDVKGKAREILSQFESTCSGIDIPTEKRNEFTELQAKIVSLNQFIQSIPKMTEESVSD